MKLEKVVSEKRNYDNKISFSTCIGNQSSLTMLPPIMQKYSIPDERNKHWLEDLCQKVIAILASTITVLNNVFDTYLEIEESELLETETMDFSKMPKESYEQYKELIDTYFPKSLDSVHSNISCLLSMYENMHQKLTSGNVKICSHEYFKTHVDPTLPDMARGFQHEDYIGVRNDIPEADAPYVFIHELSHFALKTDDYYELMRDGEFLTNSESIKHFIAIYQDKAFSFSFAYQNFSEELSRLTNSIETSVE